jgi:hypothetical protein
MFVTVELLAFMHVDFIRKRICWLRLLGDFQGME